MSKKYDKELKLLNRKNEGRCSICKMKFLSDVLTFTSVGYDKRKKLQITSYCCDHEIDDLRSIGIYGELESDEFNETIKRHPRYSEFYGEDTSYFEESYDYDPETELADITKEDRDIAINILRKHLDATAVVVDDAELLPEAFKELLQALTEKHQDHELARQKCILLLSEIADFE